MKKLCMILPLALILCFMVGCQDKEAMAELEEFRAQAEVEEQNEALIKHLIEEMNKGNAEIIKEVYAPDAKIYFPSNRLESKPLEKIKMYFRAFPDYNWRIEELYAVGDRVIVRIMATGTHEGELEGIPATGNKTEVGVIIISHIKNGKIIEEKSE